MRSLLWTSRDLEMMPDDGKRYEIVDGELYVSKQPHYHHQHFCTRLAGLLDAWSMQTGLGEAIAAPELVVEVLSPGVPNEHRDREIKLKLYSRRGVLEYWIVSWQERRIEIYRRVETVLTLVSTLIESDVLQSPLLPGFTYQVSRLFMGIK